MIAAWGAVSGSQAPTTILQIPTLRGESIGTFWLAKWIGHVQALSTVAAMFELLGSATGDMIVEEFV